LRLILGALPRDLTRHVFGEILERLIKIGGHPNLPLHPSHPALGLSGFDRMELYDGLVPLRDDDLFSVERLLNQPRKMRLRFVDCHLLHVTKLANLISHVNPRER
jgi:hypothetical protein